MISTERPVKKVISGALVSTGVSLLVMVFNDYMPLLTGKPIQISGALGGLIATFAFGYTAYRTPPSPLETVAQNEDGTIVSAVRLTESPPPITIQKDEKR